MKKTALALFLCLALLLSGCSQFRLRDLLPPGASGLPTESQILTTDPTEDPPTLPTESTSEPQPSEPDVDPDARDLFTYVPYEEFERPYDSYLPERPFSQISYKRPDAEALCQGLM